MLRANSIRPYENWIPFWRNNDLGPSSHPEHPGSSHDLGPSSHPEHPGSKKEGANEFSLAPSCI